MPANDMISTDDAILKIIKSMSLKGKIALCSGEDFWHTKAFKKYGIPSIMMSDGPHGLRKQLFSSDMLGINGSVQTTCFPTAVTSGATWNRELIEKEGEAIAEEALANDVAIVLGPGLNIKRDPLCGRNFEYFSEDPLLSGEMAAAFIKGLQKNGIACSLKHFACNNQEYLRFSSDSVIDERALREIYLAGFERAVKKSEPKSIMCAYNKINGTYCASNKKLLTDILRDEWGFDGMVVTDWGAMNDRTQGFVAGCDLSMPGKSGHQEKEALKNIRTKKLSEEDLDKSVYRILKLVFHAHKTISTPHSKTCDFEAHHELAEKIAGEGLVLLKNESQLFPLDSFKDVLICGPMAKNIRYQGAGSSKIIPTKLPQFLDFSSDFDYEEAVSAKGEIIEESFKRAVQKASTAKSVLIFVGLSDSYESEGFDRNDMSLPPAFNELIFSLAEQNPNVGVILFGGGAMELPWEEKVRSILYCGLAGQNAASVIYETLLGEINPSARLTETWPLSYKDCPSSLTMGKKKVCYLESIFVGYRYFLFSPSRVRYHFGFGLSYTDFSYDSISVSGKSVRVKITNTGKRAGSEVVQIYIEAKNTSCPRPIRELKDFAKVRLQSGESTEVSFEMDERWFSIYHDGWKILPGEYFVCAAKSADEILLREKITLPEEYKTYEMPEAEKSWYTNPLGLPNEKDWERLTSMSSAQEAETAPGEYTLDNSISDLCKVSAPARFFKRFMENGIARSIGLSAPDYNNEIFRMSVACSIDVPLHSLIISAGGLFPEWCAQFLVRSANRHTRQKN